MALANLIRFVKLPPKLGFFPPKFSIFPPKLSTVKLGLDDQPDFKEGCADWSDDVADVESRADSAPEAAVCLRIPRRFDVGELKGGGWSGDAVGFKLKK